MLLVRGHMVHDGLARDCRWLDPESKPVQEMVHPIGPFLRCQAHRQGDGKYPAQTVGHGLAVNDRLVAGRGLDPMSQGVTQV